MQFLQPDLDTAVFLAAIRGVLWRTGFRLGVPLRGDASCCNLSGRSKPLLNGMGTILGQHLIRLRGTHTVAMPFDQDGKIRMALEKLRPFLQRPAGRRPSLT